MAESSSGTILKAENAKVGVFTCGIDIAQTETKGTVLMKNAEDLLNFSTGEEKHMEKVRGFHLESTGLERLTQSKESRPDLPRTRGFRTQRTRRWIHRRRTRSTLLEPPQHSRDQSHVKVRSSSSLPSRRRFPSRSIRCAHPRRDGTMRCGRDCRDWRRPSHRLPTEGGSYSNCYGRRPRSYDEPDGRH